MNDTSQRVLITGATSGVGVEVARAYPAARWRASQDGPYLFLAVGPASNPGVGTMPGMGPEPVRQFEETHGRGASR